jgi:hypothetical protein
MPIRISCQEYRATMRQKRGRTRIHPFLDRFPGFHLKRGFAVSAFRGFAVSAFVGASRCQRLFLVFGRSVIFRAVAKSRSESGYKISERRKYGRDFLLVNADANLIARSRPDG